MNISTQVLSSKASQAPRRNGVASMKRRIKQRAVKPSALALYVSVFIAIVAVAALGYQTPKGDTTVANVDTTKVAQQSATKDTSVNEVVATTIAANVAETVNSPVANNVANLSVSLVAKDEVSGTTDVAVSKQQIVQSTSDRRELVSYTAKAGDTLDTVAAHYGVSKDTIKWANNLTSDALDAGKVIEIPPVDGVVYTVKSGDTVQSLAEKYGANPTRIVSFNDLELGGLTPDTKIIIPAGQLPETERPGYVAPRPTYSSSTTTTSSASSASGNYMAGSVGNKYVYGYCTWYVYERRAAMGRPVGSFWGNASTWAAAARSQGYTVGSEPVAGAVFQTAAGGGGYGHIGIIDSVDPVAGTVTYSDMNGVAGWNRIGSSTISISAAKAQWVFIY